MFPRLNLLVFILGLILGSILAVLLFYFNLRIQLHQQSNYEDYNNNIPYRDSLEYKYENWFRSQNLHRTSMLMDDIRYGNNNTKISRESEYLYKKINILCVVLVRKLRNAEAIKNTWGQKCNNIVFYSLETLKISSENNNQIKLLKYNSSSSWELLCRILQHINKNYQFSWAFFINDDVFAIIENLRMSLAPLNSLKDYYIGHSIKFWGVTHNVAEAGYVLSRKTVQYLTNKFSNENECKNGGRYWKQEAYYLGKHLNAANITPIDTRDHAKCSVFYGYNLHQFLFPNSVTLTNYYKYSVYPIKCSSKHTITFQAIEADKMYFYYFILYHVQLFYQGNKGNARLSTKNDDLVWKTFLKDRGITNYNITAEHYYDLWKSEVSDPHEFNARIRNIEQRKHETDFSSDSSDFIKHNVKQFNFMNN